MEKLYFPSTTKTPEILLNPENGKLEISGRSIPENSFDFYRPIIDWVAEYITVPCKQTELTVKLEYFNTASSKCLVDIFRALEKLAEKRTSDVKVFWYFEESDDGMKESGEDFKEIIKVPLEVVEYSSEV